jgi:KaiC/GvpD/RAD55 family RecA-like ATPase
MLFANATPERSERYEVPTGQLSTGPPRLDELLSGGTGVGKTLLGLHFIIEGCARGEHAVIVTFQESPSQLRHLAAGFGWDLAAPEEDGRLEVIYSSPTEDRNRRTSPVPIFYRQVLIQGFTSPAKQLRPVPIDRSN